MTMRTSALWLVVVLVGTALLGQAGAAEPEDVIKYRQGQMKALGGHMAAMAQIVRGKVPFTARLEGHAQAVAAGTKDLAALFPKDSDFGETEALPEIWKKPSEFEKLAKDSDKAADALAAAVKGGDKAAIGSAFDGLGKTCKACHDDFRKKH